MEDKFAEIVRSIRLLRDSLNDAGVGDLVEIKIYGPAPLERLKAICPFPLVMVLDVPTRNELCGVNISTATK